MRKQSKDVEKSDDVEFMESAKSKPNKHRTTQRPSRKLRRRKQSQQQYANPQIIPLTTQSTLLMHYQSYDRNLTNVIIQIPFSLYKSQKFQNIIVVKVESLNIEIRIKKTQQDVLEVELKIENEQNGKSLDSVIIVDEQDQGLTAYQIWGRLVWYGVNQIQTKIIKKLRKMLNKKSFQDISKLKTKQINSDLFLILNIQAQQIVCNKYLGLINQGNTCYMNSYLQMLYHIVQFKNLVFAAKIDDENKFPATLQNLFYRLQHDDRAVSSQQLVRSFGWTKKEVLVQQDPQQFSCIFFEKLQQKLQSVQEIYQMSMNRLFGGQLVHYIQCENVGKILKKLTIL